MNFVIKIFLVLILVCAVVSQSYGMADQDAQDGRGAISRRDCAFKNSIKFAGLALTSYLVAQWIASDINNDDRFDCCLGTIVGGYICFISCFCTGAALNNYFYKNDRYGFQRGYSWLKNKFSS